MARREPIGLASFPASGFRAYRNSLANLITNVTLSSSATQIVRQRQNAADAISKGVEAAFRKTAGRFLGRSELPVRGLAVRHGSAHFADSAPSGHGASDYMHKGTLLAVSVRSYDYQFDDDLNQFRLPGYATVQLVGRQHLVKSLSADVAVENALNRVFYTAFTPTPNIGSPRLWRVGLRWH